MNDGACLCGDGQKPGLGKRIMKSMDRHVNRVAEE
jgi:hypothetical protein